ncbi:MAG: hypothetical protein E3J64_03425 [Anaerolineales bacterium]|nr:MAG: hypothetical protein E3J64_03425 [Anaerolineales bacterium]
MTEGETLVEIVGAAVGAGLTILIFSYMLGDNPLYRLALHIFLGVLIGFSLGVVVRDILFAKVLYVLSRVPYDQSPETLGVFVPFLLSFVLLTKGVRRLAYIGNLTTGLLIGVGTAVALSGALLGTLVPQVAATGAAMSVDLTQPDGFKLLLRGAFVVVGTVCTLMTFSFAARRRQGLAGLWSRLVGLASAVGRVFLTSALAVAFAAALTTSLTLLAERLQSVVLFFARYLAPPLE